MRLLFLLLAWFSVATNAIAQTIEEYPATAVPDRILLSIAEDPATAMSVSWRMDSTVQEAYAELAIAGPSPDAVGALTFKSAPEPLVLQGIRSHYFGVKFRQLQPGTVYMYRVGDAKHRSEWIQFRTAEKGFKPFSFLYMGDSQNDHKTWWSRTIRQAYKQESGAAFLMHAGDLINRANSDREWGEWFYAGGWMHAMVPSFATPGNHEFYLDDNKHETLTKHWRPTFNLPENGPAGLEEQVYAVDYQDVKLISLSSELILEYASDSALQVQWLEKVLKENKSRWTIITMHHPIFSAGVGRDNNSLRDALEPLFRKYKVDLVLTGHDHTYGRGVAETSPQTKRQPLKGPVYVVSVSGPKMYRPALTPWVQRAAANTQLYQRVVVEKNKIRVEAYTANGELYDKFDIRKNRRGENKLVDWAPGLEKERLDLPPNYEMTMTPEEKAAYEALKKKYFGRKQNQ
jgi:acid phosphatase type 7